jgi:hypothetical protein
MYLLDEWTEQWITDLNSYPNLKWSDQNVVVRTTVLFRSLSRRSFVTMLFNPKDIMSCTPNNTSIMCVIFENHKTHKAWFFDGIGCPMVLTSGLAHQGHAPGLGEADRVDGRYSCTSFSSVSYIAPWHKVVILTAAFSIRQHLGDFCEFRLSLVESVRRRKSNRGIEVLSGEFSCLTLNIWTPSVYPMSRAVPNGQNQCKIAL